MAELSIGQPGLQPDVIRDPAPRRGARGQSVPGGLGVPAGQPRARQGRRRLQGRASAGPACGLDRGRGVSLRQVGLRLSQQQALFEPGRSRPAVPGPAGQRRHRARAPLGQESACGDEAGHRPDQLVRAELQNLVRPPEATPGFGQLVAFHVNVGHGHGRGATGALVGAGPVVPACAHGRHGQLGGAAQAATQGLQQGQVTKAIGSLPGVLRGRRGAAQRDRRLIEITGPQFQRPAARLHLCLHIRMQGQLIGRNLADQGGSVRRRDLAGLKFPLALRQAEPDDRPGEPGRNFLIGRNLVQHLIGDRERCAGRVITCGREPERGRHQQGLRFAPGLILRDALQYLGERLDARWLHELVDDQLIHGYPGGKLPVASRHGLPGGLGGGPVLPEPPGGPPVQVTLQARGFAAEFQAQHVRQQRMVAIPAITKRLDEGVGLGQRGQVGGGLGTGQLAGEIGVDLIKDARAQQEGPHRPPAGC